MKLIDPAFTDLYKVPDDGEYAVVGFSHAANNAPIASLPNRAMTDGQFRKFVDDRLLLNGLLAIEEAYDVVMGNYVELEEMVARLSILYMADRRPYGRDDHFDTARRSCHRALANLLSASRAFEDHSQRLASSIDSATRAADLACLKASFNSAYDASLGYRFMCALRNHAQHFSVSVSGISHTRAVADQASGDPELYVTTTPFIRVSDLRQNDKFKKAVLEEIEHVADKDPYGAPIVALIPRVREYISGLHSVMSAIRALYRDRETAALNLIFSAFYHYSAWFTKDAPVGFDVAPQPNPDGAVTHFGTEPHFKARTLREINGDLTSLPRTTLRQ